MKKILFITGTRADYGKIKPLMYKVKQLEEFELKIFVTGMHMMSKYGSTYRELEKDGFTNLYKYINQTNSTSMDIILSNTILGISNYINENQIDLIVVHGDRLEALAGAIVGAFNNIRVAHIEGGEVTGTIDEFIRHAISKFTHIHFVANNEAKNRLIQIGENKNNIYVIGSPDIDIMLSNKLPSIEKVKTKYDIPFDEYAILLYHPVTTEIDKIENNVKVLVNAIVNSQLNYIIVYPNNDLGSDIIINGYMRIANNKRMLIYPSIKFEYFLTLLKNSKFILGNSSAGIREAGVYNIPAIDIGNRQNGRYDMNNTGIIHCNETEVDIINAIKKIKHPNSKQMSHFGEGRSSERFVDIILKKEVFNCSIQKKFIDLEY